MMSSHSQTNGFVVAQFIAPLTLLTFVRISKFYNETLLIRNSISILTYRLENFQGKISRAIPNYPDV